MEALWHGYLIASVIGKLIIYVQLFLSVWALAKALECYKYFQKVEKHDKKFRAELYNGSGDITQYFITRRSNKNNTAKSIELMYHRTCERMLKMFNLEARRNLIDRTTSKRDEIALTAKEINLLRNTCENVANAQELELEKKMSCVATVVSSVPLMGLLGTVWGVLEAFDGMGGSDTVQLSAIAPAISSAMVTTVVGLLIAVPLALFYNFLSARFRDHLASMDSFTEELITRISIEYQGGDD